ncbi:MAG: FmdB family zinc ribbon protein [Phycisphaerales bacterium JB043]
MPTYDYRCNACEHEFELFQGIKEDAKKKCPDCGKNALERLIGTGAGVLFKGGGFHETDYRSDSYRKGAEKDKPKSDSTKAGSCACGKKSASECASGTAASAKKD